MSSESAAITDVVIGLGSNIEPRLHFVQRAVVAIARTPGCTLKLCSPVYESAPIGPPQPAYLNAGVRIDTSLSLRALMQTLQSIEISLGRCRKSERVVWGPRTIDLDILWASVVEHSPELAVPHPHLETRNFALRPLLDVAPELAPRYERALALAQGALVLFPNGLASDKIEQFRADS